MSDFLIDISPGTERDGGQHTVRLISYYDDISVRKYEGDQYSLFLSRCDDWKLWAPYRSTDGTVFVALSGRIAMDSREWETAKQVEGEGGLACKAIYQYYKQGGIDHLTSLNGSFVVVVVDAGIRKLYLINDRCGMHPCYACRTRKNNWVIGSHPDVMANYADIESNLDRVSISEFIITGRISFPHTYYKKISALDYGCIHIFDLQKNNGVYESKKKYFDFVFRIDPRLTEMELAAELAGAITRAVNRRTHRLFGQTGVSLSGGLDSRTILCAAQNREDLFAFSFYEDENLEYRTAERIAQALGVKFIPIKRSAHYYADNLEMGVRISGGLGNVYSNHYLGARDTLLNAEISNVVAGFYCDYLFKGYLLDKKVNRFFLAETLSDFSFERYEPLFWLKTKYLAPVQARLDDRYPKELREDHSDLGRLEAEKRRMYPLCYDSESLETLIPQKVLGWYLPTIDNDVIDLYLKIPPRYKLNRSLFTKMVQMRCSKDILDIEDANTGNRVGASHFAYLQYRYKHAIQKRYARRTGRIVYDGSWPDWHYLIRTNETISRLWHNQNSVSQEVFRDLFGEHLPIQDAREYTGKYVTLFFRLLTIKIWLEQCMHHA